MRKGIVIGILGVIGIFLAGCTGNDGSIHQLNTNELTITLPVGVYSKIKGGGSFSISGTDYFDLRDPHHFMAEEVEIQSGYVEYVMINPLPISSKVVGLDLSLDVESPGATVSINGKEILSKPLSGEVVLILNGTGVYLSSNKIVRISEDGFELNFKELKIKIASDHLKIRDKIRVRFEYEGKKIYQPKIAEILDGSKNYEGKRVVLSVHPGGWVCPPGKTTPLPDGFSRSAMMIYDDTGCIYGNGKILAGKVLTELHPVNLPGNETIIVEGVIKLGKNGVPFISG